MSAPSIPNLNAFKRAGFRGRGALRAVDVSSGANSRKHVEHDTLVQNTDNDAATSRQSAVNAGYLEDPFASHLQSEQPTPRRLPLMNRGTYVRTTAIDSIVDTFLSSTTEGRKQIVSLGAGSDTRYFRLKQKRRKLDIIYHELDFEANTKSKIARMRSPGFSMAARDLAGVDMHAENFAPLNTDAALISPDYVVHPQDLRQLSQRDRPLAGMETTLPTLIISECCLVYLPPDDADSVLRYFVNLFPPTTPLSIAIYEPIRPHDPFGRTMISNLASRGLQLQTLEKYHDLSQQKARLREHGFENGQAPMSGGAGAADIDFIWRHWISSDEKERVEGLEWMDEVEEFVLLAKHYCISCGWRGFATDSSWNQVAWPEG